MLAHAQRLRLTRVTPVPPSWASRHARLFVALYVLVGLVAMTGFIVLGRNPIVDDDAVHKHLSAAFGTSSWYPHLVAANADHDEYVVYLDTRDPAVQAAACSDLVPEAAKLNRVPDLYRTAHGHGYFAGSCGS